MDIATNEAEKKLLPLRRTLPQVEKTPRKDEDGDLYVYGFNDDVSQTEKYVTDGHLLLLATAIDHDAVTILPNRDCLIGRRATEEACDELMEEALREREAAEFIGAVVVLRGEADEDGLWDGQDYAFVRNRLGRVIVLDADKLAFGICAVHADSLTAPEFDFEPVALWREGKLAGLLMPMRCEKEEFAEFDLGGEAIDLAEAVAR